jgi:hypothetical protein
MSAGDPIPGWPTATPRPGDPIPGWQADPTTGSIVPDGPPIPDRLGGVWQTFRDRWRECLRLAVILQGPVALVSVPFAIAETARLQDQFGRGLSVPVVRDEAGLQKLFETYLPTSDALALAGSVLGPTLSFVALLALTVSLATLLLSPRDDRTLGGALRSIVRRAPAIAAPVLVLALGACIWVGLEVLWVGSLGDLSPFAPGGFAGFGRVFGLIILANLVGAVILAYAVYLAVRWAVAFPALVVEDIGLRAALRRSSGLTARRRLKVALTLFVVAVLTGLASTAAFYVAISLTGIFLDISAAPGLAVSSIMATAVIVLIAPFMPLALVLMYRDLSAVGPAGGPAPTGSATPS